MLQQETLVPEMINLIKELQSNSLFNNYILAGGTALTLQLGHRTSTDIDLFTLKEHNYILIIIIKTMKSLPPMQISLEYLLIILK